MNQLLKHMTGFLLGILTAIVITSILYVVLPLLTQIQPSPSRKVGIQTVLISAYKPPPLLAEDRDQPKAQKLAEKKQFKKQAKQTRRSKPKFETPKIGLAMGTDSIGVVEIGIVSDFSISDSLFMSAFRLTEVDHPPRVLRVFPPQYPFKAKRENIEGKVMLRFVVDVDGLAKEANVVKAQPEGVFEEAALSALERYKFRPAVKNGKPVTCIVKLPISFQML